MGEQKIESGELHTLELKDELNGVPHIEDGVEHLAGVPGLMAESKGIGDDMPVTRAAPKGTGDDGTFWGRADWLSCNS